MATVLYSINPGLSVEQVTIATGPGCTTNYIELQVDLGNDITDPNGVSNPRPIKKGEVVEAIIKLYEAVIKDTSIPE
jgi:hypothetical protein